MGTEAKAGGKEKLQHDEENSMLYAWVAGNGRLRNG